MTRFRFLRGFLLALSAEAATPRRAAARPLEGVRPKGLPRDVATPACGAGGRWRGNAVAAATGMAIAGAVVAVATSGTATFASAPPPTTVAADAATAGLGAASSSSSSSGSMVSMSCLKSR
uniref:Putative secreted protein n=1 Tax=Ixodes ricinus TaxID=34613 RepID=A0A6B0UNB2_IXORI